MYFAIMTMSRPSGHNYESHLIILGGETLLLLTGEESMERGQWMRRYKKGALSSKEVSLPLPFRIATGKRLTQELEVRKWLLEFVLLQVARSSSLW
jgi:hypothetical protein